MKNLLRATVIDSYALAGLLLAISCLLTLALWSACLADHSALMPYADALGLCAMLLALLAGVLVNVDQFAGPRSFSNSSKV